MHGIDTLQAREEAERKRQAAEQSVAEAQAYLEYGAMFGTSLIADVWSLRFLTFLLPFQRGEGKERQRTGFYLVDR